MKRDIRNVFNERVAQHWYRLPREMIELPHLEVFKKKKQKTNMQVYNLGAWFSGGLKH